MYHVWCLLVLTRISPLVCRQGANTTGLWQWMDLSPETSPDLKDCEGKPASHYVRSAIWRDAVKRTFAHKPLPVLKLVLKQKPFEVMKTGEKRVEYRRNTPYWRARLTDQSTGRWRRFGSVEFSHGYSRGRGQFTTQCVSMQLIDFVNRKYSNNLHVKYPFKRRGYIQINLGPVL